MKSTEQQLIQHFNNNGKTDSWLNLANQFNILPHGTNKQKSDKVRRLFNSHVSGEWGGRMGEIKVYSGSPHSYTTSDPYKYTAAPVDYSNKVYAWNVNNNQFQWDELPMTYTIPAGGATSVPQVDNDYLEFLKWKEERNKFQQPKDGIHIVIGCMHVPFHNKQLLKGLINFIDDYKDSIVGFHLVGDFLDLKSLSKHDEGTVDKTGLTLGKEYAEGNNVLDMLDSVLPSGIQKTFLYGNHEDRYIRACNDIKNNKFADALISPEQALNLDKRGYNLYNNWKEDYFMIGKYQVFHGIYCTQTPAKTHVSKLRKSCIFPHTHRVDSYFENDLHGLNIGTMSDINSVGFKYVSRIERMNWRNAFGIVHVNENVSQAEAIICNNDSFFYAGKKY